MVSTELSHGCLIQSSWHWRIFVGTTLLSNNVSYCHKTLFLLCVSYESCVCIMYSSCQKYKMLCTCLRRVKEQYQVKIQNMFASTENWWKCRYQRVLGKYQTTSKLQPKAVKVVISLHKQCFNHYSNKGSRHKAMLPSIPDARLEISMVTLVSYHITTQW